MVSTRMNDCATRCKLSHISQPIPYNVALSYPQTAMCYITLKNASAEIAKLYRFRFELFRL